MPLRAEHVLVFHQSPITSHQSRPQYRTRTRYFSTVVPSLSTGTSNCAAKAAVFVNLYVELTISQSPPIGSFTSTEMGKGLWLRSVISYSNSYSRGESTL